MSRLDAFRRVFRKKLLEGRLLGSTLQPTKFRWYNEDAWLLAAAKATPDGHVLTLNSASSVAMAPFTMQSLPYDPKKDLAYITLVVKVPEVLVVAKSLQANTVAELVSYARANPGKLNYGSAGSGTITHFGVELLKVAAKIDMVHVPYKGAAPAVADLVAGQVQLGVFDVPVVAPHIRAGSIRGLAVTSDKRAPTLPDVPSMVEAGYPTVNSDNWYGLVAAAATPPDTLKRLHTVATNTLRSKELAEQYEKVSGIPSPTTPEEYYAYMESEAKKWGAVIRAIGFKAEQ